MMRVGYLTADQFAEIIAPSINTVVSGSFQPLDGTLTALAALSWTAGSQVPTFTAADTVAFRSIGAAAGTDILDRDAGDARYALVASAGVSSFNTRTGAVTLTLADVTGTGLAKGDIGLGNVDNTSDANKPVSTAQQTALDLKLNIASYTAADVLAKILTVDGAGSGLDADTLDGTAPTAYGLSLIDDANAATARTTLGLGTAATQNTGTSGANVPLMNGANTWSGKQTVSVASAVGLDLSTSDTYADMRVIRNSNAGIPNMYLGFGGSGSTFVYGASNQILENDGFGTKLVTHPTTASAANAFIDTGDGNYLKRSTSSLVYKTDIQDLDDVRVDRLLQLRPVRYRSLASGDNPDWSFYGFIAEEVAKIDPRLVHWGYQNDQFETVIIGEDADGPITEKRLIAGSVKRPDSVQYDRLTVGLVHLLKRYRTLIIDLRQRVKSLEDRLTAAGIP